MAKFWMNILYEVRMIFIYASCRINCMPYYYQYDMICISYIIYIIIKIN